MYKVGEVGWARGFELPELLNVADGDHSYFDPPVTFS